MEVQIQEIASQKITWFVRNQKWIANELRILAEEVDEGDVWTASEFFIRIENLTSKFKADCESDAKWKGMGKKYEAYMRAKDKKKDKSNKKRLKALKKLHRL